MQRNRLNLAALRHRALAAVPHQSIAALARSINPSFTRRQILGLAGGAAVGMSTLAKAADAALRKPFELKSGPGWLAVSLDGGERWRVDADRFSGNPLLAIEQHPDEIHISLSNASYPGTGMPADFRCALRRGVAGWKMTLAMPQYAFEGTASFERWLMGAEKLSAKARVDEHAVAFRPGADLKLRSVKTAEYHPDGTLTLTGKSGVSLTHDSVELAADAISLSLPASGEPGLLAGASGKRSHVALRRGGNDWDASALLPRGLAGMLNAGSGLFSALLIEAEEPAVGRCRHALTAISDPGSSALKFHAAYDEAAHLPGGGHLPLEAVQTAIAYDDRGDHRAMTARLPEQPVWMHNRVGSFQLQGDTENPLVFSERPGGKRHLDFAPAVLQVAVGLPGAAVEPGPVQEGTRLRFVVDGAGATANADTPSLHVSAGKVTALTLNINVPVNVLRTDDMLVLRFTFQNLALQGTNLVAVDTTIPSYITVTFPPQQISDQAYLEVDPNFPDSGGAETPTIPVDERTAGGSRLVFFLPPGVTSLPYTLSSLLTALSTYPPSVADTALSAPVLTPLPNPSGAALHSASAASVDRAKLLPLRPTPTAPKPSLGLKPNIEYPLQNVTPYDPANSSHPITALELPWRLVLSPSFLGGWAHSTSGPVTHNGRTELWHTRLGVRLDAEGTLGYTNIPTHVDESNTNAFERILRAIWSPDYIFQYNPFRMSLSASDRSQLVGLMADYSRNDGAEFRYATVNRLMLTSLGAWLDSRYIADPPSDAPQFTIEEWDHKAAMGRDYYVRVVYKGYLFPFGQPAVLVKQTERKFLRDSDLGYRAYLKQRFYIIVKRPDVAYPDLHTSSIGRKAGFTKVTINTKVTPNLADPTAATSKVGAFAANEAFWPQVVDSKTGATVDFLFHMTAVDAEGNSVDFRAPLIFLQSDRNDAADLNTIANGTNGYYTGNRRLVSMSGKEIAFAPSLSGAPGKTAFSTTAIAFGSQIPLGMTGANIPYFYPSMDAIQIHVAALDQMTGKSQGPSVVRFAQNYLSQGFGSGNQGEVMLELLSPGDILNQSPTPSPQGFGFPADKSGGLATPNIGISGLSRKLGPVGGDVSSAGGLANGQFNPSDFFGQAFSAAKLFGGVLLTDILQLAGLGDVPAITRTKLPDKIVVNLNWNTTELQSDPLGLFVPSGINGGTASLSITATITINIPLNGTPSAPTYDVEGDLKTFQINMFDFIIIGFDDFSFTAKTGQKVDINPQISDNGIVFGGPLSFINELKNFIPTDGFSDPPILDLEPTGLTAGYKLAIPSIGIGVFALENISLTAELIIPFTGQPIRFRFAFCEKEHPFTLSVSIFGGGGYFGIALGVDGVESLEAALEFGGNFSFDIGIASGGVHLMAGIYFKWESNATTLTAYIRLGGSVDVLGIISISVEFYLALSYCSDGTLSGEASLKVDIHILFFSVSVTLSVHKTITKGSGVGGSIGHAAALPGAGETGAPPLVTDLIPDQTTWNTYADAFA